MKRPPTPLETAYFVAHLFEANSHMPPAFSQSNYVVYCEKSPELPDGLAEGEVDELPDPPVMPLPDEVPEPVLPDVPEGLPEPELPDVPLPLPLPDCAAAIAGAKAMIGIAPAPDLQRRRLVKEDVMRHNRQTIGGTS